jgi:glycosyltransferase involved in cell wall biosynthesis
MASGCPVVATSTGAWPEVITEGRDGYVVPCRDADALADAILRITGDPQHIQEMGRRAREKITAQYRIEDEAAGILAVYRRLLALQVS